MCLPVNISEAESGLGQNTHQTVDPPAAILSRQQRKILLLICDGLTAKEIASRVGISPKTVEFHKASIAQKIGFHHPVHLVRYAIRSGLVEA
jgi:DNA-binding CsgD family transcriptional regulator